MRTVRRRRNDAHAQRQPVDADVQEAADDAAEREKILDGLSHDMPAYPCTIREPMRDDGLAGEVLPDGEIGHLCFNGPQTFAGYINDPAATVRTISRDGYLYTGDLGYRTPAGIHLSGRAKWVIKSFGYQVFPGDVEAHISDLAEKVMSCVVVGVAHEVAGEGVVAVVEKRPGVELTVQELERHTRALATYMRPRLWIIVEPGQVSDDDATMLARDVAKKIETDMTYPGQIRVTVIRETRATELAR